MTEVTPDLVVHRTAALIALEQLDELCKRTANYEMRQSVAEVYHSIGSRPEEHVVSLSGMILNLLIRTQLPSYIPDEPPPKNTMEIGGIQVEFE